MSRAENLKRDKKELKEKNKKKKDKNNIKDISEEIEDKIKDENKKLKNKKENKENKRRSNKKSKAKKICIILIILLTIVFLLSLAYFLYINFFKYEVIKSKIKVETDNLNLNIFDINSNSRPFAVMIDNLEDDSWPQFNINEAMVVYEISVEAGISRLMAVFKDKDKLDKIGPLRSARHYFLDYVKEYDAIYVHEGSSPRGISEIYSRNIDSVAGSSGLFYRDNNRYAPHDAITSSSRIIKAAKANKFSLTTKTKTPLKYSLFPVKYDGAVSAASIVSGFSYDGDLKLVYNEETKKYEKYEKGELLKDAVTKKPLAATNIIILNTRSYLLSGYGAGHGRIHVETDREMSGYFATNGEAVKIKANKKTINSQTKYSLLDGTELQLNDGNTFIFIVPDGYDIVIKAAKKTEKTEEILDEGGEIIEEKSDRDLVIEKLIEENKLKIIKEY